MKALITGVTGQDGSYLAEFLLEKGYEVHGIVRRSSEFSRFRIEHLYLGEDGEYADRFHLHYGDLADSSSINEIMRLVEPDEIYNLGAQSHVGISFEIPEYTADVTGVGVVRMLNAVKQMGPDAKFYQASSSELFGNSGCDVQCEDTNFIPASPYSCAKAYAFYITRNYRSAYDMFAANGILFNHESPRRGENFVSRKITLSLAKILAGQQETLVLGNLEARRDWGYAGDYVEAMWLMLQAEEPEDYVIATGETHSVREFVQAAAEYAGICIRWEGEGLGEKGVDVETGKTIVEVSGEYFRPQDVDCLCGDYSRASKNLGWEPKTRFEDLVKLMMDAELKNAGMRENL